MSDYQGTIDWGAVRQAGIQVAVAKATEGVGWISQTFAANWAGMKAAGLRRGAYHFARSDQTDPASEAAAFLGVVGPVLQPADFLVLDLEVGDGNLSAWALAWLHIVEQQTGRVPWLYSGEWFLAPHGLLVSDLARYPLWLATYQGTMPDPPAPWTRLAGWQYTDTGTVPGISGHVDRDWFWEG